MANLRNLKKDMDYLLEELVFDCDMAILCQPSKEAEIFDVMRRGVELRNDFFEQANNPFGKKEREAAGKLGKLPRRNPDAANAKLVRKQYAALRARIGEQFGSLFEELSAVNK